MGCWFAMFMCCVYFQRAFSFLDRGVMFTIVAKYLKAFSVKESAVSVILTSSSSHPHTHILIPTSHILILIFSHPHPHILTPTSSFPPLTPSSSHPHSTSSYPHPHLLTSHPHPHPHTLTPTPSQPQYISCCFLEGKSK